MELPKGKAGNIGDIRMKLEKEANKPLHYQVKFSKGSYELDGFRSITRKPSFARECAMRITAYPPKGYRIAHVKASSSVVISKDKGAAAGVKAQLMTAQGRLGEMVFSFDKGASVRDKSFALNLEPNADGQKLLKQIPCEKPKIIGMDIQFSNHKESYVPKVKIRPNADSLATMLIVLEKCTLNAKVKNGQKSSLGS